MPTEVNKDAFGTSEMHTMSYILKIIICPNWKME